MEGDTLNKYKLAIDLHKYVWYNYVTINLNSCHNRVTIEKGNRNE